MHFIDPLGGNPTTVGGITTLYTTLSQNVYQDTFIVGIRGLESLLNQIYYNVISNPGVFNLKF